MYFYNDNQNPNHWYSRGEKRQDSSQSPYYQQPVHNPLLDEKFSIAAIFCGVSAMFCNCIFLLPITLASLGFLFCALSYRKGKKRSLLQRNAVLFCCFGMVAGAFSCLTFFNTVLPRSLQDPFFRNQFTLLVDTWLRLLQAYGLDFQTTGENVVNSLMR